MKLSVVIITKNEEDNIKDCLESVKWVDEIVLVDNFSTDNTVKIAKKYTNKIYQIPFGGFGPNRKYGETKAKNDWILVFDADERLTKEGINEIKTVLKDPKYGGYYMPRKNYFGKKWLKYGGQYPSYQIRLYNKNKGGFNDSVVHEKIVLNGKLGYLKYHLLHYNFKSWSHYLKKANFYTDYEAKKMIANIKFVWFIPIPEVIRFAKKFLKEKKRNSFFHSFVVSREILRQYELIWLIPFRPFLRFFKFYVLQLGFLDGFYGFVWCVFKGFFTFVNYVKYYEIKRNLARK